MLVLTQESNHEADLHAHPGRLRTTADEQEVGVPNRTSYEHHLPAEMSGWYSAVELQRTPYGRSADACLGPHSSAMTRVVESPYPWGSKLAITEPMAKNPTKPPMAMKKRM
jgi:hypothetical protein